MKSHQSVFTLKLRYPFGISRGVSTEAYTCLFRLGVMGQGEGTPVRYKDQKAEDFPPVLEKLAALVTEENIGNIEELDARSRKEVGAPSGAQAAFDIALWDAAGRRAGKPVHALLGKEKPTGKTTYTVSLGDNAVMEERAREAAHLPFLKIKLGRDAATDLDAMKRIRKAAPNAVLRVDANAGWDLATAREMWPKLGELGVEFIEQPLKIGNLEELKTLTRESELPIVVDEDAQDVSSLAPLRGRVHGINIKLMKCGGITEALRMIRFAREEGWMILIGCMLETRLGLGAASQLAGLVDYMDVDAHMLTTNDPFPPGSLAEFSPELPLGDEPGIGLPHHQFA